MLPADHHLSAPAATEQLLASFAPKKFARAESFQDFINKLNAALDTGTVIDAGDSWLRRAKSATAKRIAVQ